jgi:hypothetical protein
MHVHANQINPNSQLDALYAAEKAAANRAAARTRKKLSEFALKLAAQLDSGEGAIMRLGSHEESEEQTKHQNQQTQDNRGKQEEGTDSKGAHNSISDWV